MTEKSVLILSESLDYHGLAVQWGLETLGVRCDWWERSLFPKVHSISACISEVGATLEADGSAITLESNRYRAIWNRRGQVPQVDESLTSTDRTVAKNESICALDGVAGLLLSANPDALVVNPFEPAKAAGPRLVQLSAARASGFCIPRTLVSNDPRQIRAFFEACDGRVVAKQHFPFAWRTTAGDLLVTGTTAISEDVLSDDRALRASPMIYQECLQITDELRVIAFGHSAFALAQSRSEVTKAHAFRDVRYERTTKQLIDVPELLSDRCRAYMRRLGLTFAAFDIARTPSGQDVFLEANEAGQFLFLEAEVTRIPMLDAFCQFLASGNREFRYGVGTGLSLADFERTRKARDFHLRYEAYMRDAPLTSPFELVER